MSYTGKAIDLSKFGKQKEVELASERVELGMLQDLDKRKEKFINSNKEVGELIFQVLKLKSKFKSEFKSLSKEYNNLLNEYEDLFKKASDIGVKEVSSKAFKSQNELTSNFGKGWDNDTLRFMQK